MRTWNEYFIDSRNAHLRALANQLFDSVEAGRMTWRQATEALELTRAWLYPASA